MEKDDSFAAEYLETYRKFTMNDDKLWRKELISLREGCALFVYTNYKSINISDIQLLKNHGVSRQFKNR